MCTNCKWIDKMAAEWPHPHVFRVDISRFTGGMYSHKTMANLDYQGKGPKMKTKMGNKVAYSRESVVDWLKSKCHHR